MHIHIQSKPVFCYLSLWTFVCGYLTLPRIHKIFHCEMV